MTDEIERKPDAAPENPVQAAAQEETAAPRERRLRTVLFQVYLIGALSVFAILAVLASTTAYFPIDVTITQALQSLEAPWFEALMRAVSWLGYTPQATILTLFFAVLIFLLGYRWEGVMTLASAVLIEALNNFVKYVVHRPRPPSSLVEVYQVLNSYSFPSGHVMYYVGLYGFMLFLVFVVLKRRWLRAVLITIFSALILLVGISRIYLGEHWASDVLAAYLLGGLGLTAMIAIYRWGKPRFFVDQPIARQPDTPAKPIPVTAKEKKDKEDLRS
jgi:membrane-associated phospholipid phosphatase